jgi:hypothetical protein
MALSLRMVIGGSTAAIVLVVATITLAITYSVSIAAVRATGESLATAIVNGVQLDVEGYLGQMENHLHSLVNITKLDGYMLPSDDPDTYKVPAGQWKEKWVLPKRALMMDVNYSYTSIATIFADGSLVVTLINFRNNSNYVAEAGKAYTRFSNGTGGEYIISQRLFNYHTKRPWNVAEQGPELLSVRAGDARIRGYYSNVNYTGLREKCFYFPPSPDNSALAKPSFILFAFCTFVNGSNTFMGQMSIGRNLEDVDQFLRSTPKTPNTQIFAVDSTKYIIGSTHALPSTWFTAKTDAPIPAGCSSTNVRYPGWQELIGCRTEVTKHPYSPLAKTATDKPDFVYTASREVQFVQIDGDNYYVISTRIATTFERYSINLVLFMPEADILGDIVAGRNVAIIVTACVFVVAAVLAFVLVGVLLAPIDTIAKRMYLTAQLSSEKEMTDLQSREAAALMAADGDDDSVTTDMSAAQEDAPSPGVDRSSMSEIRALQTAYTTMDTAVRSFTRYVPRDVVKELMATNQMCEIQMRPMRCSMLFTDIAGFTSICERVAAPMLSGLVRLYFERASRIVMSHGGVIDKFIGDCIMAVWGAPIPIDTHEMRSSVCSHARQRETEQNPLLEEFAKYGEKLVIRVGVATGDVLAGNMGSRMRV